MQPPWKTVGSLKQSHQIPMRPSDCTLRDTPGERKACAYTETCSESEQVHRPYSSLKSSPIKRQRYTKCAIHIYSGISLGYTKSIYTRFNMDEV